VKLLTIDCREVAGRPGILLDSGEILDLVAAPSTLAEAQWIPQSVVSIIAAGDKGTEHIRRLIEAVERADTADLARMRQDGTLLSYPGTTLMAPIRRPGLVLISDCPVAAESTPAPSVYIKSPNTVIGHLTNVNVPAPGDIAINCKGLLGIVLGKPLYMAGEAEAESAISAYTLLMDLAVSVPGSGDSCQTESSAGWRSNIDGRQFPGACPMGPVMITTDEINNPDQLNGLMTVNGCVVDQGSPCPDPGSIGKLLSTLSSKYGFRAGDVVAFHPPGERAGSCELHDGDTVSFKLEGVSELTVSISLQN